MLAADKIIEMLEGTETGIVFGLPCGQMNPYYASLASSTIRHIPTRSEAAAAIMADGYARANFTIGVCDSVGASGAAYQSVGIVEAFGACSPVVALTGDNSRESRGREVIQDLDNKRFMEPITKESHDPETPDRAIEAFRDSVRVATVGVPGPTHINLPSDVIGGELSSDDDEYSLQDTSYPQVRSRSERDTVKRAVNLLSTAERPVILSGEGSLRSKAWNEIQALAEKAGMPVITSLNGKGIIAETAPHSAGVAGRWGYCDVANEYLEKADTVLALGCRFGDLTTDGWSLIAGNADLIHVDLDPKWLEKNYDCSVPVMADIKLFITDLLDMLDASDFRTQRERIPRMHEARMEWFDSFSDQFTSEKHPINPQRVIAEIDDIAPSDAILVSATSYVGFSSAAFYRVKEPGIKYIQARGSDGINFCLPQSLGVQAARPDQTVFALSGDGGFGYHIAELETAVREELPVNVVVVNNDSFGSSKVSLKSHEGVETSTDLSEMSYAEVARGFGCEARTIVDPDDIEGALTDAIDSNGPMLLDIKVNTEDLPPGGAFGGYRPKE